MRTIAGLIVGLALGILLMYFTLSTVKVSHLSSRPPATANPSPVCPPPVVMAEAPAASAPPALAQRLGEAAGRAAVPALRGAATVLVLESPDVPLAAGAVAGFRQALATRAETTLVGVADIAAVLGRLDDAAAVFCPDHAQLAALDAQAAGRKLPPVYTVGWSEWLLGACAAGPTPVVGVAVVDPAAAVRLLTPRAEAAPAAAPAASEAPVVVLTPAQFAAAFARPEPKTEPGSAAEPAPQQP